MLSDISSAFPIIFTIIWQSSLFIAAGLMASRLCKRHPARAHQVLFLSMIAAVAVPFMTIAVKHLELGIFMAEPEPAVEYVATSEVSVQPHDNPLQDFVPSVQVEPEKPVLPWRKILLAGWGAASVIFLARLLLTFILGIRVVKKAQPFEYPKIAESIKAAASKLGIKENIVAYGSKSVSSPVIWCWKRRPILLLPSDEKLLNDKIDLMGILCHELAHLKRRDHVAGLLSELMVVFLPWHPLLWWAKNRLLSLSEHACDDWVIAAGGCGVNYAESLLDLVPAKQMAFVPAVVRNKNILKGRVIRMLKESYGNPRLGKKWILSAVLITTCITLTVAFAQTRSASSEAEPDMAREEPADEGTTPADLMTLEKRTLENPDMMSMERRMHEKTIAENYGALFERLELPDETIQSFRTLIVDYEMQRMERVLVMTDQSLTEEERREKLHLLAGQQAAEFEKQAMDLLGAENYEMYDAYKRRLTERFLVMQFINPLDVGEGFSDEKEQALIDAMYDARKEVEAEYGADSSDSPRMLVGVSSKDMEEGIDKQLEIYDRYIESARGVLSESQAEQFEAVVKGMKETTIMAAEEMANEMANGGPPQLGSLNMEKKRQENPDIMNMERRIQEKMIVEKYGALFESLELPDEEINDFKTLLVDFEMQIVQSRPVMMEMDSSLSEKEIKEKLQLQKDQKEAELEKQARDLLGPENYEIYDAYRARLWEHQLVTQYINPPGAVDGLSDEKEQALIDAMYKARKEAETGYGLSSYDGMQFFIGVVINSTDEERARRLEIYDRYIESAWDVLSESQAEQFETIIEGMQETMIMAVAEGPPSFPGGGDDDPQ